MGSRAPKGLWSPNAGLRRLNSCNYTSKVSPREPYGGRVAYGALGATGRPTNSPFQKQPRRRLDDEEHP